MNYDVTLDIKMMGTIFNAMVETYSTVWNAMKENQDNTSGDYYILYNKFFTFFQVEVIPRLPVYIFLWTLSCFIK